jgi:hypothetical protein
MTNDHDQLVIEFRPEVYQGLVITLAGVNKNN